MKKLRFLTSDGAVSVVFRKGVKSPAVSPDFTDNTNDKNSAHQESDKIRFLPISTLTNWSERSYFQKKISLKSHTGEQSL